MVYDHEPGLLSPIGAGTPNGPSLPSIGESWLSDEALNIGVIVIMRSDGPTPTSSGSTIACAMLLGLSGPAAFRLSFLMSLPAVGGAVLLKALDREALAGLGAQAALGAVVAFFVGLVAIWAVRETISLSLIHI